MFLFSYVFLCDLNGVQDIWFFYENNAYTKNWGMALISYFFTIIIIIRDLLNRWMIVQINRWMIA